jgi:hypothetical protein
VTSAGTLVTTANDPVVDAKAVRRRSWPHGCRRPPDARLNSTAAYAVINEPAAQSDLDGRTAFAQRDRRRRPKTIAAIDPFRCRCA